MRPQTKRIREQKRIEAEERQKRYERRSVEEQLMILDTRPGESRKERKRLNASA